MAHCSHLVKFYLREKFCVSHALASRLWDVYCLKPPIRPGGKNYISGHIWHKSFIQMVKSSFFKQIIVNQSFYGVPLTFSFFFTSRKCSVFRHVSASHLQDTYLQVSIRCSDLVEKSISLVMFDTNRSFKRFIQGKVVCFGKRFQVACLASVYLCQKNVIFRLCLLHEDGIEACIPGSIWQKTVNFWWLNGKNNLRFN